MFPVVLQKILMLSFSLHFSIYVAALILRRKRGHGSLSDVIWHHV